MGLKLCSCVVIEICETILGKRYFVEFCTSFSTLCDNLRRERDRAVSDLADALRNLDDMRKQKNDTARELKELK